MTDFTPAMVAQGYLGLGMQPPLDIIYEDSALIAVNKPAGQLFHGYTKGFPTSLADQVKDYVGKQKQKAGNVYLGICHRLDRPVSGVSVFARNSKVAARVSEQFQDRTIEKWYLGYVHGVPAEAAALLEDELTIPTGKDKTESKLCRLRYQLQWQAAGRSLLAIALETGRRHQIRKQLARRGLILHGDLEYGSPEPFLGTEMLDHRFRPIALHAAALQLQHPLRFDPIWITAVLPRTWTVFDPQMLEAAESFLARVMQQKAP
ncbi:MAG: RluA family pseudouridine synthase [Oligoflexus sp.]